MSNLQAHCHLKLITQKVYQHTGRKRLIHSTKQRQDNHLQGIELPNIIAVNMKLGQKHPIRLATAERKSSSLRQPISVIQIGQSIINLYLGTICFNIGHIQCLCVSPPCQKRWAKELPLLT